MKEQLTPILIFSVSNSKLEIPDRFRQVQGCWRGELETSYIAPVSERNTVLAIATDDGQQSILLREPDGSCFLISVQYGDETYIGQWRETSKAAAELAGTYTYDQTEDKYYITVNPSR